MIIPEDAKEEVKEIGYIFNKPERKCKPKAFEWEVEYENDGVKSKLTFNYLDNGGKIVTYMEDKEAATKRFVDFQFVEDKK